MLLGKRRSSNKLDYMDLIINLSRTGGWGGQEGINGYLYLNNIINLFPRDWVEQISKMDEDIDKRNQYQKEMGEIWLVQ